ncbi:MAG: right-handed parallel beta-helix repeat-containing protein [Planctomycetes bacterium]|nr:right-handed parallel beta-helix repeat-containing protein [Planctomycetota bacterium]
MTPDELISGQLDGTLDEAGLIAFDAWLAADRVNQVRWCQTVLDHQHLRQRGAMATHATTPSRRHLRLHRTRSSWIPWASAAAALLVIALGWWATRPPLDDAPVLAGAEATEVLRADGDRVVRVLTGETLRPGDRLTIGAGRALLHYRDGTRITVAAGSTATVLAATTGKRLRLDQGDLTAEVRPQPSNRPLVVSTTSAEVVVVGTTLNVASTADETRVGVATGTVRVERGADTIAVPAGSFAVAAKDAALLVRRDAAPIGEVHRVGAGQRYATPSDLPKLNPGDVVELHPGTHRGGWKLLEGGTALRPLVIRGIGSERPVLDASGQVLDGVGATARAVLQLHGTNVVVEHLTIMGGRNGRNAAGIRCVDAQAITIRDCRIHDCDQGIDATADRVLIEDNDIGPVGTPQHDGYCHLLHLGGGAATVRGNLLHDAPHGQALMSANHSLVVEANRISGCADGEMSFLDIGRERSIALSGNVLVGQPRRAGANRIRTIELHGTHGGDLRLSHNTIVAAEGAIILLNERSPMRITANGNILVGSPQIAQSGKDLNGTGNLVAFDADISPGFGMPLVAGKALFIDPAHGDYRLRSDAPYVSNAGTTFPDVQPKRTAQPGSDPRPHGNDPGAFTR